MVDDLGFAVCRCFAEFVQCENTHWGVYMGNICFWGFRGQIPRLVGGLEHFLFFHIFGRIIPTE